MTPPVGPQHQRYAAWLESRRGPRDPHDEVAVLEVADAYDAAMQTGTLSAEQLQCVVDGASSSRALLWNSATDLLADLSARWPAAADAIATMSRSRQAHVRFAALCSLGRDTPAATTDAVLTAALRDKSSKVRWKAVDRANRLERRNLVPEITAALAKETNARARRSMELDLRMLRDGYWMRPDAQGGFDVTVRRSNGIASRRVSDEELQSKGLEQILAELRK
jgi:hypothetical protein